MDLLENEYVSNMVEMATRYFIACPIVADLICRYCQVWHPL